jgi:alkylation response protein AidB-like acyl-CoA dehydrogenase
MDFDYNDDQQMLMTAFDGLLSQYRAPPQGVHGYVAFNSALQRELVESGFLEIASQAGFGLLEGALLTEAAAACPHGAELAASTLVAPILSQPSAPLAIAQGLNRPVRYLQQAQRVVVLDGDKAWEGSVTPDIFQPVTSVLAYPLATLVAMPADATEIGDAATVRRRQLIGIAAEAAGLMRGALDHTVQYVKDRQQFGQPLGHFQAIQHRLAECAQLVRATRWLAFRAADVDGEAEAATACLYAQEAMRKLINDCHQFSGAMGLTLEFPLHLWTYRLKFLQGEAGGKAGQARRVTAAVWPQAA